MKKHAKAPSPGSALRGSRSTAPTGRKARGLFGVACLCVLALTAFIGSGAPAAGAVEPPSIGHVFVEQVGETSARLNGVIETHGEPTTYHFEYGSDTSYGSSAPVPDAAVLTAQGTGNVTENEPTIKNVQTSQSRFVVGAPIEGAGIPPGTTIAFVGVGTITMSAFATATATGASLSSPAGVVSEPIENLDPGTTYHYKLVADGSGTGESTDHLFHTFAGPSGPSGDCPNETLRAEQHSTFLPDCRAYEMVTPVEKNGADVTPSAKRTRAAAGGDAVQFGSLVGFGDSHGVGSTTFESLAERGAGGWSTHGITPPQEPFSISDIVLNGYEPMYSGELSPDLSHGVFTAKSPPTGAAAPGGPNLYLRDDLLTPGFGSYQLVSESATPQPYDSTPSQTPFLADASDDFSHITFQSGRNLTPEALAAEGGAGLGTGPKVYEWVDGATQPLRLASQVPSAPDAECGGAGPACVAAIAKAGGGADRYYTTDTLSADGSRTVFTTPPFADSNRGSTLYLRGEHGTDSTADDTTTQLNVSERTSPEPPGSATFWAASSGVDAASDRIPLRVFFTSAEKLTDDDPNESIDLYMWKEQTDGDGHHLTRLSVDSEPADNGPGGLANGHDVSGVLGASADGSYVYFAVTQGQLVAGGPTGATGGPGGSGDRIFVWHDGSLREVGAVNSGPERERIVGSGEGWGGTGKWSRLSPDGTSLAFVTEGTEELLQLYGGAGYDHGSSCPSLSNPECEEVYVYSATAKGGLGDLQCASCNPTGQPATADAGFQSSSLAGSGGARDASHLNHALSADGRFVFFTSAERLVEEDTNAVEDAYEFDTKSGQVHLISTGTGPDPAQFLDASADGTDVFFSTREQIASADGDRSRDLYDARIDGGFPEPTPPAPCDPLGGGCQGSSVAPPQSPSPQSAALVGPGDRHPRRPCPRGTRRVHRHGKVRCLKKPRRHHARYLRPAHREWGAGR